MSFRVLCEPNTTTYLAFTYPYSYKDLQIFLSRLEKKHGSLSEKSFDALTKSSTNSIYFHRENVCYSLEKRRIDLLTISGVNGVLSDREEKLDKFDLFSSRKCLLLSRETSNRSFDHQWSERSFVRQRRKARQTFS